MALSNATEFSSNPIKYERVTNLSEQNVDLVNCPVCAYILWKPVTCSSCENFFCLQCLQVWLDAQKQQHIEDDYSLIQTACPFNCLPYKERKCPPLLLSILSKLTIECRNKSHGCQEIVFYEQLEKHEENLCQYKMIQCSGCKQTMFQSIFDKEQHALKCPDIETQCEKCQSIFKRKYEHTKFDCLEKQLCLVRQEMTPYKETYRTVFDEQNKKIEILNKTVNRIEENLEAEDELDDNQQTAEPTTATAASDRTCNHREISKWFKLMATGLFMLNINLVLIWFRILFPNAFVLFR